jgi:phosphoribosyl 1,2-cyclic phosphate phosphodiesterase
MYLSDIGLLFDTPEEIASQLNREGIGNIDYIFYSHWHPDHTLGLRIIEMMNLFWLGRYVRGDRPAKKIRVCASSGVLGDLKNVYGSFFDYYEGMGLIEVRELEICTPYPIGDIRITPFEVKHANFVSTVFLIEGNEKRVVYGPCNVKPFPSDSRLTKSDLFILGNVFPEGPLKEGITIPQDNELRVSQFSMQEALELVEILRATKTVFTHLEEEWGRSYDDYKVIEEQHSKHDIRFAYDSMKIHV